MGGGLKEPFLGPSFMDLATQVSQLGLYFGD